MQLGYPPPRVACTVPILPKAPSEKAGRAPVGRESANGEGQGGAIVKTDRDLIIEAVEEAQRVLAEYLEPGALRSAAGTIHRLVTVLDRPELVGAIERMKASRGLRLVK